LLRVNNISFENFGGDEEILVNSKSSKSFDFVEKVFISLLEPIFNK